MSSSPPVGTPSLFDQALDLIARMHGQRRPMADDGSTPMSSLTPAQQQKALRTKAEDRPVQSGDLQADDFITVGGLLKGGLKMAGRKAAQKLAPAAEKKAGNWVLNKAEMGLDKFDRALVTKQNEFAAERGAKATAVDPAALRNEAAEAITTSGRQDITR